MNKKLIEVALPLEVINREAAREKSIRHGHPSTLHLWWARRPLAACRAVLFASLVDDPSSDPDRFPDETSQEAERDRLFRILEELVTWEGTTDRRVLELAKREIRQASGGKDITILDPFAGGGSIPLEAKRLGLAVEASDLNPVAVAMTGVLVRYSAPFAETSSVGDSTGEGRLIGDERAYRGLSADLRHWAQIVLDRVAHRIGSSYPEVETSKGQHPVALWFWARTVQCPNPACAATTPLVRSLELSTKRKTSLKPVVVGLEVKFEVAPAETSTAARSGNVARQGARCFVCNSPIPFDHIRAQGRRGRLGRQLLAMGVPAEKGRTYLPASPTQREAAERARSDWEPVGEIADNPGHTNVVRYGMEHWADLFTPRQLGALSAFSTVIREVVDEVEQAAAQAGLQSDDQPLALGGSGARAYGELVALLLAFALDKCADYWNTIATWVPGGEFIRNCFARQAIPMTWDFVEANPFSAGTGGWRGATEWVARAVETLPDGSPGEVFQRDARAAGDESARYVISTDPPYYDNIIYADIADFFYVWLRQTAGDILPDLFSTLLSPRAQELVAPTYRFDGDRGAAKDYFERGLGEAFARMRQLQDGAFPLTVFYAFKQSEATSDGSGHASTGWETMLEGLLGAGFAITGTWPMRTERTGRSIAIGSAALASSIVLVCRPRPTDSPLATRREFVTALRAELPEALKALQHGNVAPVDLAQSAIGPGMAVFSRFGKVVEADGTRMSVRTALSLINQALDELLSEQEGDFDAESRWAVAWFEQAGMDSAAYGLAETLCTAKNTAVNALVQAGIIESKAGRVRLLDRDELDASWDPATDLRLTIWEIVQYTIRALEQQGEQAAGLLIRSIGGLSEPARALAYRLYLVCERKGWAQEALAYNGLVVAWPELARIAMQPLSAAQSELEV